MADHSVLHWQLGYSNSKQNVICCGCGSSMPASYAWFTRLEPELGDMSAARFACSMACRKRFETLYPKLRIHRFDRINTIPKWLNKPRRVIRDLNQMIQNRS
mgnify:CR=1 FL=1